MSDFEPDLNPGEERLREVCEEVSAWLEKWCSPETQLRWYYRLSVELTVLIRTVVDVPGQAGTIQAANECLHFVIGRLADEHFGRKIDTSLSKLIFAAQFGATRAAHFDPPPDLFALAKTIHHTYEMFVNPDYR